MQEYQTALQELNEYKKIKEDHKARYQKANKEAEELKETLSRTMAERDKAIGEKFMINQNLLAQEAFRELQNENRQLEEKLINVKVEYANSAQLLDAAKDDALYLRSLISIRDNEIVLLNREMEKVIKQRNILREKTQGKRHHTRNKESWSKRSFANIYTRPPPQFNLNETTNRKPTRNVRVE